ncbi:MAG: DUF72 domain-containing protein [Spirochaetales bacterium]|nr:DUF72 domain-containing protein [Spirochaetales bacterium]
MGPQAAGCHIGTSGWSYPHWKKRFYPEELPSSEWLGYYARRLSTVEINNSFYNLPSERTVAAWRNGVPGGFSFAVKASRYITHMKKLKDPEDSLERFLRRIRTLGDRLGPVLFQLPPQWIRNPDRLQGFLEALPAGLPCAFEFRDRSWFHEETYVVLERHNAAFCIYELAGESSPKRVTADFVYVRLHGPGRAYQGSYDTSTLAGWAGAFSTWNRQGKAVYCYFNNDQNAYAVHNARELANMMRPG